MLAAAPAVGSPTPISFYDVRDPSAFVHANINKWTRPTATRGPIVISTEEHEELHAEGMAIMCKLARDFRPHIDGYEHEGRFSGYAAMFLARKLGDAWHRMHSEHLLISENGGPRRWDYRERAVSLEALGADDPDRLSLLADRRETADLKTRLHAALWERWCREVQVIVEVGEKLSEGATPADVAGMLGLTSDQVAYAISEIGKVAGRLESGNS